MHTDPVSWDMEGHDLWLRVGTRGDRVPLLVATLLMRGGGYAMTDDPAVDLIRLELDLRRYARFLEGKASEFAEEVEYGRDSVLLAEYEVGRAGRRHRQLAVEYVGTAAVLHMTWADRERHARAWIQHVRQFVIDAAVPGGPLADAAAGWRRRPERPAFVTAFASTADFVAADTRRADPAWWSRQIDTAGGVSFGTQWRRDGDDDDSMAAPLPHAGPWHVAYLPRTGEVYAARRAGRRTEEVWLLARHHADEALVISTLTRLMAHMGEPNSLILVAETLYTTLGEVGTIPQQRRDSSELSPL